MAKGDQVDGIDIWLMDLMVKMWKLRAGTQIACFGALAKFVKEFTFHSFRNGFYWFSSVTPEQLIFHNISEKRVRTIHKATVYSTLYIILKA